MTLKAILLIITIFTASYVDARDTSITNVIAKELRGTLYSARATTIAEGKRNSSGNGLNCIAYAFRIKSVVPNAEIWLTTGKHAVVIISEKGKRICYSNGRISKEGRFTKVKKISSTRN